LSEFSIPLLNPLGITNLHGVSGELMYRLDFESPSIDLIQHGFKDLRLRPLLGLYQLDFLKPYPVEIRYSPLKFPVYRFQDDIIGLYVLFYGVEIVKLGTSSVSSILSRMYAQAPLYGLVYSVFVVKRKLKIRSEDLDEQLYECIKKIEERGGNKLPKIMVSKPPTSRIVEAWLLFNNTVVEKIGKVLPELIAHLSGYTDSITDFERIVGYGDYWFTPYCDKQVIEYVRKLPWATSSLDELKNYCKEEDCEGTLTVLPNGLCVLEVVLDSNRKQRVFITTCDNVSYKLLITPR